MGNIHVKEYQIWTSVQEMSLVDWNHLCNIGRRLHEDQPCEIILYLDW